MLLRTKILFLFLALGIGGLSLRELGYVTADFYSSASTISSEVGPSGNFTSFPFRHIAIERVKELGSSGPFPPDSATIRVMIAGDFPKITWMPFYKSGESVVVAVYQVYYDGTPIGATFYGAFNVKLKVTGLCSHRTYRNLAFQAAESSISAHVARVLQRKNP